MTSTHSIWEAVVSAQDAHGDAAETFARAEALDAAAKGDAGLAATWKGAADQLSTLNSINRHNRQALPQDAVAGPHQAAAHRSAASR